MTDNPIALPVIMQGAPTNHRQQLLSLSGLLLGSAVALASPSWLIKAFGVFALAFFGYAGYKHFRPGANRAGLTLTEGGVTAISSVVEVPWNQITDIGFGEDRLIRFVGFNLADPDAYFASMPRNERWVLKALTGAVPFVTRVFNRLASDKHRQSLGTFIGNSLEQGVTSGRDIFGYDVVVVDTYLDRSVDQAAATLAAARDQQVGRR